LPAFPPVWPPSLGFLAGVPTTALCYPFSFEDDMSRVLQFVVPSDTKYLVT
jgi:hypothetical protein